MLMNFITLLLFVFSSTYLIIVYIIAVKQSKRNDKYYIIYLFTI